LTVANILNKCGHSNNTGLIYRYYLIYSIGFGITVGKKTERDGRFTTIRIRKIDRAKLYELALPREAHWETMMRIISSFEVKKIVKRNK